MSRPATEMLDAIRTILRTFTIDEHRFPPAEGRIKYNPIDFQSLYFVGAQRGCSGAELAGFLGVAPTTAQSVCDRLIQRGLMERAPSETSRRAVSLLLTDEGDSVLAAIRRQDLANCETMLSALPREKRRDFVAQLQRIADSLSE